MIVKEYLEIGGKQFVKTYSDKGNFIENEEGVRYGEAFDLATVSHVYTETDINIEEWEEEERRKQEEQDEPIPA